MRKRDLSLLSNQDVNSFWESAHNKKAHLWLTGTMPQEVIKRFGIEQKILELENLNEPAQLLDVGVGEGLMSKYLSQRKILHDVLDVSVSAIKNVVPYCQNGFIQVEDLPKNQYKIIMHHLVAQHMSHENLTAQSRSLVKSLRGDGSLFIQYSSDNSANIADDNIESQKMGAVIRNPTWFVELANSEGFAIRSDLVSDKFGDVYFRVAEIRQ